jgi:hypothetical protein
MELSAEPFVELDGYLQTRQESHCPRVVSMQLSPAYSIRPAGGLFGWRVVDGWCWFVLREEYCWLVAGGWFVLREKYCWLVAEKPNEQAAGLNDG